MEGFTILRGSVLHERAPVEHVVKTAFGVMNERHGVFLMLEDDAGRQGIGESWVNFPHWAPWERVAAFERAFIPYLTGRRVADVAAFVEEMYRAFVGPARQSGTIGPLLQALCGVELALWDLDAQAAGLPLARRLWNRPHSSVRVYASGINSPLPWDLIEDHLRRGFRLFKLKIGFGPDEDRANIEALSKRLDGRATLAVDVNRGWTLKQALEWLPVLREHSVQWLEEPLRAEEEVHLKRLREAGGVPIAAGENVLMPPGADMAAIAMLDFDILQPDITKYAPLHVARRLLADATAAGKRVIPHFLGSAPGQAASLHFAAGCPEGLVEMDINRNPLRTCWYANGFEIADGQVALPDGAGLGWARRTLGSPS